LKKKDPRMKWVRQRERDGESKMEEGIERFDRGWGQTGKMDEERKNG
jgi:hypothetical protein